MSKLANLKQSATWYDDIIPSTGQKIRFKAYSVGDERALLMAEESADEPTMVSTMEAVTKNCIESFDPKKEIPGFTSYDLEYLFTKIRSKSVGEESRLILKCQKCETKTSVPINLEKIYIGGNEAGIIESSKLIKLSETRGVKVSHPTVVEASAIDSIKNGYDRVIGAIALCIRELYDGDEIIDFSAEPQEEIVNFVRGLDVASRDLIAEFIFNPPETKLDIEFKCTNKECGEINKKTLSGVSDFF